MDEPLVCCICGEPAPAKNIIGRRAYCDLHFAQVNKHHIGYWRAGALQIVLMGIFSAIIAVLADNLHNLSQMQLILIGLFLAIVPTVWWLAYFYREDQLEPEPKTRIAQVLGLALLLTYAVGLPLINDFFNIQAWSGTNRIISALASILIIGFT